MASQPSDGQDLRELYRELILDHARSPRHFGKIDKATHSADGINPLCGDKLHLYFTIDANGRIDDATFEGSGCAISVASASLLTDVVRGLDSYKAIEFSDAVLDSLTGEPNKRETDIGKLQALQGVREFPSRVKCATLAWHAMRSAIKSEDKPVSTE
jgi:nitrogen fixation NifU-like protein